MPIKYQLVENKLTTDPNDYFALVKPIESLDLAAISQRMVDAGSTVTEADIAAVFTDFVKQLKIAISEGYRVNIGDVANLYPSISGVFHGADDGYDPARHTIQLNANPSTGIISYLREHAHAVKEQAVKPLPVLLGYVDLGTGETNTLITSNNIGTINGSRLKYNPEEADEGVYLIPIDGTPEQKVETVQKNKPSQLVFLTPELTQELYYLEVRTRVSGGKDLRVGRLDKPLQVTPTP